MAKGFFARLFSGFSEIDDDFYDELEEQLILGDMGVNTTMELMDYLKDEIKYRGLKKTEDARRLIIDYVKGIMKQPEDAYDFENKTCAMIVIGVNGVGKTTCIGKLANQYRKQGKKVLLAGADTFRAAAIDQLKVWADRAGCMMIAGNEGADPGSVIYDAAQSARARKADMLICDTAGRLHNKKNLMNELAKLDKILSAEFSEAVRENIIVLDATTGQNAMQQAKEFKEVMKIDGIILTKLDSTAKGGIAVAITSELGVPVKYIGVGEGIDDIKRFDPDEYVENLFAAEEQ
ncbi:MAG: signal recognition particle-docking protein FtsY [Lachnospiraceae bacterium]|nr:signal recognition particle-docking protein FtsY [Lachnospiraceae bacterium]